MNLPRSRQILLLFYYMSIQVQGVVLASMEEYSSKNDNYEWMNCFLCDKILAKWRYLYGLPGGRTSWISKWICKDCNVENIPPVYLHPQIQTTCPICFNINYLICMGKGRIFPKNKYNNYKLPYDEYENIIITKKDLLHSRTGFYTRITQLGFLIRELIFFNHDKLTVLPGNIQDMILFYFFKDMYLEVVQCKCLGEPCNIVFDGLNFIVPNHDITYAFATK